MKAYWKKKKKITEYIRGGGGGGGNHKTHIKTTQLSKDTKKNVKFSLLRVWLWLFAKPGYGLEKRRDQTRVHIWDNLQEQ